MNLSQPIVTLTLNPALDLTLQLPQLHLGEVNLARQGELHPAGKGINVARVLRDLGQAVIVTGILGEENRREFDALFQRHGFENAFLYERGNTRINVKISEEDTGRVSDINLPGLQVAPATWQALGERLQALSRQSQLFVLSGSIPRGLDTSAYAVLIDRIHAQGGRVIVDTSGAALRAAVDARPQIVKPNLDELSQWAGRPLPSVAAQEAVIRQWLQKGIRHVVLSCGREGLRWYSANQAWEALPPAVEVVSTVGAGDSLVAGLAYGLANGMTVQDTLVVATAAAALAVSQVGVGIPSPEALETLKRQVSVRPLAFSL